MAVATRKDLFGCHGELFWLAGRIKFRTCLTTLPPTYVSSTYTSSFAYASAKTQIQRCLCNCRWNLAMLYAWKLTISTKIKYCRSKVLAAKHAASLQLLCTVGGNQARLDARTEFKNLERSPKGGVEAGRAHHCRWLKRFQATSTGSRSCLIGQILAKSFLPQVSSRDIVAGLFSNTSGTDFVVFYCGFLTAPLYIQILILPD